MAPVTLSKMWILGTFLTPVRVLICKISGLEMMPMLFFLSFPPLPNTAQIPVGILLGLPVMSSVVPQAAHQQHFTRVKISAGFGTFTTVWAETVSSSKN